MMPSNAHSARRARACVADIAARNTKEDTVHGLSEQRLLP